MTAARLLDVPAAAIRLTPANPRSDGAADLDGLVAALAHGLAQRPTLVEVAPDVFEVLTGERRVRAGLAAGWERIPALVEPPLDPLAAHTRRLVENLHRRDLGPLDEARALKLGWLGANAVALDLAAPAGAALAAAGSVRAGLAAVQALLAEAGWAPSRPAVTQEAYLTSLGLGLSTAALRKKLQVLNLSGPAQAQLETLGLSAAAIRAFLRLAAADQEALLAALAAEPALARAIKTIIQDVTKRGYPLAHALALARGEVWAGPAAPPDDDADAAPGDADTALSDTAERAGTPAPVQLGAEAAAQAAALSRATLELLTCAETIQSCAAQIAALLNGRAPADLPEHGELIAAACELIVAALAPFVG